MLFNSLEFLVFLPIVFSLYWLLRNSVRWQNLPLIIVSYIFYGWWNYNFLFLIALTPSAVMPVIYGLMCVRAKEVRKL